MAAALAGGEPDFLIVDADLQPDGGLAVCRTVCGKDRRRYIYSLLMVGTDDTELLNHAIRAGVDDFIAKPIVHGELLARLRAGARVLEFERRATRQSRVDRWTGLPSRVAFEAGLRRAITSQGTETPVVVFDLDNFRSYNEKCGRPRGDEMIGNVAQLLTEAAEGRGEAAYLQGNRFAVMLPGLSSPEAVDWANQLRETLANAEFSNGSEDVTRMTASFGLALARSGEESDSVLERATLALQEAKDSGRDCVVCYGQFEEEAREWANLAAPGKMFARTVARDLMTPCTLAVRGDETLEAAAGLLRRSRLHVLPIVDAEGKLSGVLSSENVLKKVEAGQGTELVNESAETGAPQVQENTSFTELMEMFIEESRGFVVVVDGKKPSGYVTRDGLAALIEPLSSESFAPSESFTDSSDFLLVPDLCPLNAG